MEFIFNSIGSKSKGLKVRKVNHISLGAKNYESIPISGRTGNLIIDDGSFANSKINVNCILDLRQISATLKIKDLRDWLQRQKGYKLLSFSDGIKYNAICSGEIKFKEVITGMYEVDIDFEVVEVI